MRVVFDTNILVSALTLPSGRADSALRRIVQGEDSLAVSRSLIDELLSVLAPKFAYDREALSRVALCLADLGETVEPRRCLRILADEPDNRILECAAAAAGADLIVTGDRTMLAEPEFRGVRIMSLREYLGWAL